MEIIENTVEGDVLKIEVDSNEESLFFLIKAYLEKMDSIEIAGVSKSHHLVDNTQLHIKVKTGDPLKVLKKALFDIKTDLEVKKIK